MVHGGVREVQPGNSESQIAIFPAGRGLYLCWELESPAQIETSAKQGNRDLEYVNIFTVKFL